MRIGFGVFILFCLGFAGIWPLSLFALFFFISALIGCFKPDSDWAQPGIAVATGLGTVVVLIVIVVSLQEFFDGDC